MSIQLNHLTHVYNEGTTFEKVALNDVTLEIQTGEFIGLIGHTGSGKSTLIQHLNGIISPSSGEILLDGENIHKDKAKLKEVRRRIGLAFQYPEYQLFEMTVYKDVAFGPTNLGLSAEQIHENVVAALNIVGIDETFYEKSPFELSGGQKRRVAIAGVLAMEPRLLVLDEPAAGLDPEGRDMILGQIREYHKQTGSTIVLVSHSMEDIAKYADRVLVMNTGRIAMYDATDKVFARAPELLELGLSVPEVTKIFLRLREMGLSTADAPDILNFRKLLRNTDFTDVMTEVMRVLEEKYSYPVDIEYACNFDQDGNYRVNLLQCRPLQTRGVGAAGVMPNVKEFYFRTSGNFMGGNVCLPIRYAVMVQVEPYLDLPEQRKYQVARKLGELNNRLRGEGTILLGPGRWGTTTPSLGVPVHFMEINRFDCIAELAYSSHGLRPELSYGSHFFQDLVEAGSFYVALYPGEDGCVFQDTLFADCENVYAQLMPSDAEDVMADVIRVYDLGKDQAILYSEVGSQTCFLAKV